MINDSRERRKLVTLGQEQKLNCDHCEWSTGSKTLLNRHTTTHHKENPLKENEMVPKESQKKEYISKRIKCDKCDKKFNKVATFKKHMDLDHEEVINPNLSSSNLPNKVTFPDKKRSLRNTKSRNKL